MHNIQFLQKSSSAHSFTKNSDQPANFDGAGN